MTQPTPPTLGSIVRYVGKYGIHATRAAIVSCTQDELLPEGDAPALDSPMHVHLTVFTPAEAGMFPEVNIPYDPDGAPGTWSWPPRADSPGGATAPPDPAVGQIVIVPADPARNNGATLAPAVITRVWSVDRVNVRVLLDGPDVEWRTSAFLHPDANAMWETHTSQDAAHPPNAAYWPPRTTPKE